MWSQIYWSSAQKFLLFVYLYKFLQPLVPYFSFWNPQFCNNWAQTYVRTLWILSEHSLYLSYHPVLPLVLCTERHHGQVRSVSENVSMLPSHNEDCAEKVLWQGELHHGGVNLPCKLILSEDPRLATNWPAKLCINKLTNEQALALVHPSHLILTSW